MNFYSGPRGTERWWDRRNPGWQGSASKTSTPGDLGRRRVRCRGDLGKPLTLGAGLGACSLPRLQDQVQQEEGGRAWGRHSDSSAPRGLYGRQWRGSAGTGLCPRAWGSERASGTGGGWGGAQPSVGRWLLGSAGRSPRFMVQRPRGKGEGGGGGGGPSRGGPLGQDPPFAGKSGGGRNRERGPPREQRPDRTGVRWTVGRDGWALGRVKKGRDEEGVGCRGVGREGQNGGGQYRVPLTLSTSTLSSLGFYVF